MRLKAFKDDNVIPSNGFYNSSNWYMAVSGQLQTMLMSLHGNRYVNYEIDDPFDYDPTTLKDDILAYLRDQINALFIINNDAYAKMYAVLTEEYDPLWNYDGTNTLHYVKDNTGTDNVSGSNTGTQTTKDTTADTNTISRTTYDSAAELEVEKASLTHDPNGNILRTDNLANTNNRTVNLKEEYTHEEVKHGNQGTTTTQSMLVEEMNARELYNLNRIICNDIAKYISY